MVFCVSEWESLWFFQVIKRFEAGDHLSPTLFIIAAEVLARGLNKLHEDTNFKGYGMPKWSPKINHLSCAEYSFVLFRGKEISEEDDDGLKEL